jgi:uncharacterized membrane protein HdeD (DUF308 family)
MEEVVVMEEYAAPKWWSLLLRGLLAIAFGIILLVWPAATTWVLVFLFGIFVILIGLVIIAGAIVEARAKEKFFWTLVLGILSVGLGILALLYPGLATVGILVIIAVWAIFTGFVLIVGAFEVPAEKKYKWGLGLVGALSLIVGIILLVFPGLSLFGIIIIVAAYAIAHGILLFIMSFWARSYYKQLAKT